MLDLNTLRLVSMVTFAGLVFATLALWRLVPQERSLRDWATAAVLLAIGMLLLGVRGMIPDFFSIVIANTLIVLGIGFLHLGSRNLLGAGPGRNWHWYAACGTFLICVAVPSLALRVVATSLIYTVFFMACAALFWRKGESQLGGVRKITALIFAVGALLFMFRALHPPAAPVSTPFVTAPSWIEALPYMYAILIGMWLSITLMLIVSIRLQYQRAAALERAEQTNLELQALNRKLAALSCTDDLTGIANRRRFDEVLASEWSRAVRTGQPLALAMLDVDWFKKYNDCYGHQAGDECLLTVSRIFAATICRTGDLVARYGGEEFVFIAPATDGDSALAMARNVCEAIQALALPHENSRFGHVTASIGVAAMIPHETDTPEVLLKAADQALYRAKELGRNLAVLG